MTRARLLEVESPSARINIIVAVVAVVAVVVVVVVVVIVVEL